MKWSVAQQKVIDTRNKNVLVSAAAGSGKTAVLVERIITMISEGENPIDIDRLLVVTFTNAAAAEMRGRIGKAIEEKLVKQPDNHHLQRQISLLQSAQITTIHSFCLNVIRNYFHRIDLDPSFKIAEESEITLMKSDVISDLLERWYEEGREEFHAFVESYSYSKSDAPLEDLILHLFGFSMSDPWPREWIENKRRMFELHSVEEMEQASWMKELLEYVKAVLGDLQRKNQKTLEICHGFGGPTAYEPALLSDLELIEELSCATTYEEYRQGFSSISFARLSSKKEEGVMPEKKDQIKALREEIKKGIKDITAQFFFQSSEEMLKDILQVGKVMGVLFDLTLAFMEDFEKKKEEKNLIDFNDLEHFALKILVSKESSFIKEESELIPAKSSDADTDSLTSRDGSIAADEGNDSVNNREGNSAIHTGEAGELAKVGRILPTQAALELSEQFVEILIDEYQDSNMVQETILKSISREDLGYPNRFMVGDVKQSIYKFRLAMPEIFMEKYYSYEVMDSKQSGEENLFQRIDLDKNFRSRKIVLDYVNKIFEQIMQKSVGGILYDESASLKYGELFEETLIKSTHNQTRTQSETPQIKTVTQNAIHKNEIHQNEIHQIEIHQIENTLNQESPNNEDNLLERIPAQIDLMLVTEEEFNINQQVDKESMDSGHHSSSYEDMAGSQIEEEDPEEAVFTKRELEARMIARKIKELTDPVTGMVVFDKKAGGHRAATYKDIVILLRSISGWSEVFVNTLMQEGISAYADTGSGYFQTLEIMTLLNMLRIIDNPRQDIPLTGVLYSPIVGLSTTELAMLRASTRNGSMYSALLYYSKEGGQEALKDKMIVFLEQLNSFRAMVNHKPLHELIQTVLDQTGYYYYVSAMVGGDRRKANIDMLIAKAIRFEKGSYTGLFHFIRYIEKLHKYEVDFGEASTAGEQDNTVRIMSIHKSKGLEFPIVFVAGMSKQFNTQDLRSSIVLNNEMGVGPECIDAKLRTKIPTLIKKVIQKKVQIENLGEELRVLYVALTRPKEKLILTGYIKSLEELKEKDFSFFELLSAKSYLDWVLPATINKIGWEPEVENNELTMMKDGMSITIIHKNSILKDEVTKQIFIRKEEEELIGIKPEMVFDEELKEKIKARFEYEYPYKKNANLKVKMTVSELKKLGQFQDEEQSVNLYHDENQMQTSNQKQTTDQIQTTEQIQTTDQIQEVSPVPNTDLNQAINQSQIPERTRTIPNFMNQKDMQVSGTDRGTLYHKVLELLDLTKISNRADVDKELERMVLGGRIKSADLKQLKTEHIRNFATSEVAKRMSYAAKAGKLYKEKQFVIGIKAMEVMKDYDSDELILIQGIIDVYFEEDGELVLLDYKSDLVMEEEQLIHRYQVQLNYYRKALEQMIGKRVKEMIIYSLPLGKEIRIED